MLTQKTWKLSEPPQRTGDTDRDLEALYEAFGRMKTDVLEVLKGLNDKGVLSITQAAINESTIGASSPSTGAFTTISATGQITSTLVTGTAPFVIASTTVVTNLNADMVDGRHADINATGFTCAVRDIIGDLYTNAFQAGNGTAGSPTFVFSSDQNTGIYRVGADALGISAGGTKRVEVNTTQLNASGVNVLGFDFIASRGDGTGVIYFGGTSDYLYLNASGNFEMFGGPLGVEDGSTTTPGLHFRGDTNTGMYRAAADKLALVTGGTARFWINASGFIGAGIDPASRNNCVLELSSGLGFPATQLASTDVNVLDDYEEGTFTPTITAGSGTFTTVSASAEYTKIGNRVLWYAEITITVNGTAAGYIIASGFPFTFGQTHEGNGREAAALGWQLQSEGNASGSSVIIVKWDNSYPTDGANGRVIRINGQYRV